MAAVERAPLPLRLGRWLVAGVAALAFAASAVQLGRADAGLGAPFGPERLLAGIEPGPSASAAEAAIARQVLHDRPVEGRAYRVLAAHAAAQGQAEASRQLYLTAVERWPRERIARAVLAEDALARGDLDTSFEHLDALLRVAPSLRAPVLASLAPHLGLDEVSAQLIQRLQADPPWRGALPAMLLAEATPAEPAERLLAALADTLPPSEAELKARMTLLQRLDRADAGRAVWLATLDAQDRAADGLVFDGGFERPGASGGHGWQLRVPAGASVAYDGAEAHAGDASLAIHFGGRAVQFNGVRQALVLAPGRHRLQAASNHRVQTSRPFAWHVTCAEAGRAPLARLELPDSPGWQEAGIEFDVPAGCATQVLELRHGARGMGERQLRGTLHVDEVRIEALPLASTESFSR